MNNQELLAKIEALTLKWRGKEPIKYSSDYWRYRSDQNMYLALQKQLKTAKNSKIGGV